MSVPKSHSNLIANEARSVISTYGPNNELFSGFCFIKNEDDRILLSSIDEKQVQHISRNQRISVMVIDPLNVDRWFCIQGTVSPINVKESHFPVIVSKVIKFPKTRAVS